MSMEELDKQILIAIDELSDVYPYGIPAIELYEKVKDIISERKLSMLLRELKKDKWVMLGEGTGSPYSIQDGIYSVRLLKLIR